MSKSLLTRFGFARYSAVELLVSLAVLIIVSPFLEGFPGGDLIEAAIFSAVLVSAVLAVGGRRRTLLLAAVLAAPAVIGKWLNHTHPSSISRVIFIVSALLFLAFIVVNLMRFVLRSSRVNTEVLCASIAIYLLLGLSWSFGYMLTSHLDHSAFSFSTPGNALNVMDGPTAFYFSFVTLSTVGYGDITPVSHAARMLAVTESTTGPLYVAILIARLVALYSTEPNPPTPAP